jgi:hypothetical protein
VFAAPAPATHVKAVAPAKAPGAGIAPNASTQNAASPTTVARLLMVLPLQILNAPTVV